MLLALAQLFTAILTLIVDGFGCWISILALKTTQRSSFVLE